MKLAAANLKFMADAAGEILTQGLFKPVGRADANAIFLIALYMGKDPAAHHEMQIFLQERGDMILDLWKKYFRCVMASNLEAAIEVETSVQDLIRRVSNAGKDPGEGDRR